MSRRLTEDTWIESLGDLGCSTVLGLKSALSKYSNPKAYHESSSPYPSSIPEWSNSLKRFNPFCFNVESQVLIGELYQYYLEICQYYLNFSAFIRQMTTDYGKPLINYESWYDFQKRPIPDDALRYHRPAMQYFEISRLRRLGFLSSSGFGYVLAFMQMVTPVFADQNSNGQRPTADPIWPLNEGTQGFLASVILVFNICTRLSPRHFEHSALASFLLCFSTLGVFHVLPDVTSSDTLLLRFVP